MLVEMSRPRILAAAGSNHLRDLADGPSQDGLMEMWKVLVETFGGSSGQEENVAEAPAAAATTASTSKMDLV